MTPGHTISIVPTAAHVEVRVGARLLASTDRAGVARPLLSATGRRAYGSPEAHDIPYPLSVQG